MSSVGLLLARVTLHVALWRSSVHRVRASLVHVGVRRPLPAAEVLLLLLHTQILLPIHIHHVLVVHSLLVAAVAIGVTASWPLLVRLLLENAIIPLLRPAHAAACSTHLYSPFVLLLLVNLLLWIFLRVQPLPLFIPILSGCRVLVLLVLLVLVLASTLASAIV